MPSVLRRRTFRKQTNSMNRLTFCRPTIESLEDRTLLSFSPPTNFPAVGHLQTLLSADLTGTGKLNLVTADRYAYGNTVSVLLHNGDGTFAPPQEYDGGYGPDFVTAARLRGPDKPLDLIVADAGPGWVPGVHYITVLLNQGDGTFVNGPYTEVGNAPSGIAVGDFDNDGQLDLAVTNRDSNSVSVLHGNGDGSFSLTMTLDTDQSPSFITTMTFNGQLSLVVACYDSNCVNLYQGNGDGTFATERQTIVVGNRPASLAVADLDGDGKLDLAVANSGAGYGFGTLSILLGNNDGTFRAQPDITCDRYTNSIATGDINHDGVTDLVTASAVPNDFYPFDPIRIFEGRRDGTFCDPISFHQGGYTAEAVVVGDFNGDQRDDVATANWDSGDISVLLNDRTWFATPVTHASGLVNTVAVADFDGDGRLDVAASGYPTLRVMLDDGHGHFNVSASFDDAGGGGSSTVEAVDLNHDGIMDLVYVGGPGVVARLGLGHGEFSSTPHYYEVGYITSLNVGDFNNDGNIDVATGNIPYDDNLPGNYEVGILFGNGDGTFRQPPPIITHHSALGVAIGDLNHDGNDDIVTANYGDGSVDVILSRGNGAFATPVSYRVDPWQGGGTNQVIIADVNGDEKPDLVTANRNDNDISVFLGHGDGTFGDAQHTFLWPQRGPLSLTATDLNGDRKLDLVIASSLTGSIVVLLNQGDGTFGHTMPIPVGVFPQFVTSADFNHDGASDIVIGNWTDGVTVLLNNNDYTALSGLNTTFTDLAAPTITYGTKTTTFSGKIDAGGQIPKGSVLVTFNNSTKKAPVDSQTGEFSATFDTGDLLFTHSPYTISYSYAGDATFNAVSTTTKLNVIPDPLGSDVHWINPAGGDWDTPEFWNIDAVPSSSDKVILDTTALISINANAAESVAQLTLTRASKLTLNGDLTVGDCFTWQGGALTGSGTISIANNAQLGDGMILSGPSLVLNGKTSWGGRDSMVIHGSHIVNHGTLDITSDGTLGVTSSIVGYWPADGNAVDVIHGAQGSLVGGAGFVPGRAGQAFGFDGATGYITTPANPPNLSFSNAITIDAWIHLDGSNSVGDDRVIVDKSNPGTDSANYRFGVFDSRRGGGESRLFFWNGSGFVTSQHGVQEDTYAHVAVTISGTTFSFYINGQLDSTYFMPLGPINAGPLTIGRDILGRFFHGEIDDLQFYDRALSTSEIATVYRTGFTGGVPTEGMLINDGTVLKSGGSGFSTIGIKFANYGGTVDAEAGTLVLAGGGISTGGTYLANNSGIVDLTGGSLITFTGMYTGSGSGKVLLSSGTLYIGASGATFDFSNNLFQWTGGTITGAGSLMIENTALFCSGGTLDGTTIVLVGVTTWTGEQLFLANGGQILNHGSFKIEGDGSFTDLHDSLTGWWPAEGNAKDVVGGKSGALVGNVTFAPGQVGQAFSLDGSSYVQLPDNYFPYPTSGTGNTPFTFATWFQTSSGGVILGQQSAGYVPAIYVGTDGLLHAQMFWDGLNQVISPSAVNDGKFHHVVVSFDGSSERVYLDGVALGSHPFTQLAYFWTYQYQLGVGLTGGWPAGNGGWYYFQGLIDNAEFFNRALNGGEVTGLYEAEAAGNEPTRGSFVNDGTIIKTTGAGTTSVGIPFFNQGGTLDAESGILSLSGGGSSTGGLYKANGTGIVDLTGGSETTFTGTFTGSGKGKIELSSGTIAIGTAGATFNFPGQLFQWTGGGIAGAGALTNVGTLNLSGSLGKALHSTLNNVGTVIQTGTGLLTLGGTINNQTGATYDLQGDASIVPAPPVTENLVLNLQADSGVTTNGSAVTSWADRSGQNHDASQTDPGSEPILIRGAMTGRPALRFNGYSNWMALAGQVITSQQFTVLAVVTDTRPSWDYSFREIISNWDFSNQGTSFFFGTTNNNPIRARLTDDFGGAYAPYYQQGAGALDSPSNPFLFTGVSGGSDALIYQGDTLIANKGSSIFTRNLDTPYVIGRQGPISEFWYGDISAVMVYDGALTQEQLQQDWAYLKQKYLGGTATIAEPAINNWGLFKKSAGTGTSSIDVAFNNQGGTVCAETGTLSLVGGGISTGGTYNAKDSAVVDLTGGSSATFTGTYTGSGSGKVQLSSGTFEIGAAGATLDFPNELFQWTGGTVTGAGTLTIQNTALLGSGGTLDGATLVLDKTTSWTGRQLFVTNGGQIINHGTFTIQGDGAIRDTDGLVAFWSAEGNAKDIIGGNDGALQGGATFGSGQFGQAFTNLDGVNNYISVPASPALQLNGHSSTVENWVNVAAINYDWVPLSAIRPGAFGLWYNITGHYLLAHVWSSASDPGQGEYLNIPYTLPLGSWIHVAQVFDSTTASLSVYINGALVGCGVTGSFYWYPSPDWPLLIGKGWFSWDTFAYSSTSYDEVSVYSRALSAAEIEHRYRGGAGGRNSSAGSFLNDGTVIKTTGTGISSIGIAFSNLGGTVEADSGTLSLSGGGNSTGGIYIAGSSTTVDLTGSASPTFTGTYTGSGDGTVAFPGGSINIGPAGATFDFPDTLLQWHGGAFNLQGHTLTNRGTITLANLSAGLDLESRDRQHVGLGGTFANEGTIVQAGSSALSFHDRVQLLNATGAIYDFKGDGSFVSHRGLVAWWPGDGNAIDVIGGHDGTLQGATAFESGEVGSAFANLDGVNNYVLVPASPALNLIGQSSTLEDWVDISSVHNDWVPLTAEKPGTFGLWYNISGHVLRAHVWTNPTDPGLLTYLDIPYSLPMGTWIHVAQVYDASLAKISIYINGSLVGAGVSGAFYSWGGSDFPLLIGKGWVTWDNFAPASTSFDEVSVYNRALGADEIRAIYDAAGMGKGLGGGQFINRGTVIKTAGAGTSLIGVAFDNRDGILDAEQGTVALSAGGFRDGGTYNANGTGIIDLTGDASATFVGIFSGSGSGTVELGTGAITIDPVGATFDFTDKLLKLSNGSINLDGHTLTNAGNIIWNGSSFCFYGEGTFLNAASATFDDQTDGTFGSCDGNCAIFENEGLFAKSGNDGVTDLEMELDNAGIVRIERGKLHIGCGFVQVLDSTGSVSGPVDCDMSNKGNLNLPPSPAPPPVVTTYTQTLSGSLIEQIGGLVAGKQYGQIVVTGDASLDGTLRVKLINGFIPQAGDQFTILDNQGSDPISGAFEGLPEGATFADSTSIFQISYQGGDGNDVVLTYVRPASPVFSALAPATVVYGTATTTISGLLSAGGPVVTGSVSMTLNGVSLTAPIDASGQFSASFPTSGLHVASSPYVVTFSYAGNDRFSAATATSNLAVTPVQLTVTADSKCMTYGGTLPSLTASYSGFVNGDGPGALTGSPSLSTSATSASEVGSYKIAASQGTLSAHDYLFAFANGTLSISRASLLVTVANVTKVYGQDDSASLTGTISGIRNNDPISAKYTSLGSPVSAALGKYAIDALLSDMNTGRLARDYDVTILQGVLTVLTDTTSTKLASSANPSNYGQAVTFTATVTADDGSISGTPTGSVTFYDGSTVLGTVTLSGGVAKLTTKATGLSAGIHSITAHYNGDATHQTSTSASLPQSVLSAQQQMTLMIDRVNALVTSGVLNSGEGNALTVKLQNAIQSLDSGNTTAGVNQLNAFINQVNAFMKSKRLTNAQGQALTDAANQAIASAKV